MNLTKIKETSSRLAAYNEDESDPCGCTGCNFERKWLASRVPDLITEIERIKILARAGWQEAKELADSEGLSTIVSNAERNLAEVDS